MAVRLLPETYWTHRGEKLQLAGCSEEQRKFLAELIELFYAGASATEISNRIGSAAVMRPGEQGFSAAQLAALDLSGRAMVRDGLARKNWEGPVEPRYE